MGHVAALAGLHDYSVNVAFEVVHPDQRLLEAEGERLRVRNADEQRSGEAGAFGDGDGLEVGEGHVRLGGVLRGRPGQCVLRRCSREASSGTTPP